MAFSRSPLSNCRLDNFRSVSYGFFSALVYDAVKPVEKRTRRTIMNIGTKIKELRKEKKNTQEALAEYLRVSSQAVSKWETGDSLS